MKPSRQLYVLSFILAFCSFSYEILLAFVTAKITGFEILSQTFSIGSFILGLGLGAIWIERNPQTDKLKFLFSVEVALSVLGGFGVIFIYTLDAIFRLGNGETLLVPFFLIVQIYILLIGFLSGLELPCLLDTDFKKRKENMILGFHYMGTLFSAALVFTFLIPKIDVFNAALFIALINSAVALWLLLLGAANLKRLVGLAGVSLLLVGLMSISPYIYEQYLKVFYFQPEVSKLSELPHAKRILDTRPAIRRYRSKYQYIDFIDEPHKGDPALIMFLDQRYQFSSTHEKVYHEQMVHVPMEIFAGSFKKVLILGGGDGLIARELLKYPEVEEIRLIELDEQVLNFSTTDLRLRNVNHDSMNDPRVKAVVGDAVSFVRSSTETFDAVFLDFPYPNNYDLSKLYSLEFYSALRKRLSDKAFIILDYPVDRTPGISSQRNEVILSTLHHAGFKNPMIFGKEDTFVVANADDAVVEYQAELKLELLSKRSQSEFILRPEIIEATKIQSESINSIFKPKSLQLRRAGW